MKNHFLIFFFFFFSACTFKRQSGPYKGYDSYSDEIYFRYVDLGTKTKRILTGETMEVFINYSRMNDSVFWDSHELPEPHTVLLSYDSLKKEDVLAMLINASEGDSLNFIIRKKLLFARGDAPKYLAADSMIRVNIRIVTIHDSGSMKEKINNYALSSFYKKIMEQNGLTRYLEINSVPDSDKTGGIYFIPLTKGYGPVATNNSRVTISYRGYFMNHKTFDSVPLNNPLDFTIGDSGQVINGLETGIKKMREGEIAKIIIPSHSAFGEKGSSTGIVPPYTTLIYEVTIIKVKPAHKK